MGEIKSTLELVMEKADRLRPTEEEKAAFQEKEMIGRIRGFLQKYLDRFWNLEQIQAEIEKWEPERRKKGVDALMAMCLEQIEPEQENKELLEVMERLGGVEVGPVQASLARFRKELKKKEAARLEVRTEELRQDGIEGSAVIPNLRADAEWRRIKEKEKAGFRQSLTNALSRFPL